MTDYVLVAADPMRVEHLTRHAGASWTMTEYQQPHDRVPLRSLEVDLTLAQIYRRVTFTGESS